MTSILMRGLLAGLLASLLAFSFAKIAGEPQVDRAIAFEEQAAAAAHEHEEPELVSRGVQASYGLLTGVVVFGTALGGLFAIAYAFVSGRLLNLHPRSTALVIAGIGFLVLYLVPFLKYPANPPSVGAADTIVYRTQLYFSMIVFSLAALALATALGRQLATRFGGWNGGIAGVAAFIAATALTYYALPSINEVPSAFPADLLWQFRVAALGTQAILWGSIGLVFGALMENVPNAQLVRR